MVATGFVALLQVDLEQLREKCSQIRAKHFFFFLPHLQVLLQLGLLPGYKWTCN
jgi:hypothetical protein